MGVCLAQLGDAHLALAIARACEEVETSRQLVATILRERFAGSRDAQVLSHLFQHEYAQAQRECQRVDATVPLRFSSARLLQCQAIRAAWLQHSAAQYRDTSSSSSSAAAVAPPSEVSRELVADTQESLKLCVIGEHE